MGCDAVEPSLPACEADPAAELALYAGGIVAVQITHTAALGTAEEDGWTATGDGIIDRAARVPPIERTAATPVVAEPDSPADGRRFARRSLDAMRGLGLVARKDPP